MKAFEVLDQENKGYLATEELTKYMSEEGHYPSFSQGSAVADLVVSMVNALNFLFLFFFYLPLSFFLCTGASLRDTQSVSAHSLH